AGASVTAPGWLLTRPIAAGTIAGCWRRRSAPGWSSWAAGSTAAAAWRAGSARRWSTRSPAWPALVPHRRRAPATRLPPTSRLGARRDRRPNSRRRSTPSVRRPRWPGADRWYLNVGRPAASFCVEIGLATPGGRFLPLARSNVVTTPRATPSPDTTVRWVEVAAGAVRESARAWEGTPLASVAPESAP